jgi:transposase InsO family protein
VRFTRQFRHYLLGKPFKIRTDHSSLTWLLRFKDPQGQLARWLEELSQYDMEVEHRAGKKHGNADALSRISSQTTTCPFYRVDVELKDLPYSGCKYCTKAHTSWHSFEETVDNVAALSKVCSISVEAEKMGMCIDSESSQEDVVSADGQTKLILSNKVKIQNISESDDACLRAWDLPVDRVQKVQSSDNNLIFLVEWLATKKTPTDGDLLIANPAAKYYWMNRNCFILKNGLIWRLDPKTDVHRLVIPERLKEEVMYLCHCIPAAGHQGEDRTLHRTKLRYYWHGLSKDIKHYIASCPACSKWKKPLRKGKWELTKFHAGAPLERVHLDFLGPLPKTSQGNEYVLMVVDQFTKWVECLPLPSQTAEQTAKAVVDHFFSRFGCPLQIFTDRGSNFESKLFASVCELLQIHRSRTTAYRPSANGQVERYNRTLMDAVRCFVGKNPKSWDKLLPQIAGALRASVNRHTGFTPNQLMLGREVYMPTDLVFPCTPDRIGEGDPEEYVDQLGKSIRSAHEIARQNLKSNVEKMKKYYDVKLHMRQFEAGDAVYVLNVATAKGQSRKFAPPWKGPAMVEKRISPYLYKVRMQRGSVTTNHDRMKLCRLTALPAWLKKAQRELRSIEPPSESSAEELFCVCNGPDLGQFMLQCDGCDDWFHGECVNMTEEDAQGEETFFCPRCDRASC